jgi:YD repeat-containing protein
VLIGQVAGGGSGESFAKYFSYSTDGLNLLKSEDNDDNCKVKIFYKSGTDLITSKHTYHDGQMVRRTFFSYDKFGSITKLVQDDGITIDESDLTGVTERHIQRTVPRAKIPFGVPSVVSDFALDLATGQERLLHKKKIDYREDGMVTKEEHFDGDDTYRYTLLWEYDSHGNLTREVDALGQEVTYVYDENDCLVTERRPSVTKRFVYDGCNRVLKETLKKNGQEICTKYRYDVMGNLIKTFDSCGRCKLFQYDAQDRLVSVTDCPTCGTQKFAYDPLGNIRESINENGEKTKAKFTVHGKPYEVHYPDGTSEATTYDRRGNITSFVAKNGLKTLFSYDLFDHKTKETLLDKKGNVLEEKSWIYNSFHLLEEIDAEGVTTTYSYDFAGRLVKKRRLDQTTTYSYDALGRQTEIVECGVRTTCKTYNLLDQVVEEAVNEQAPIHFTYDTAGNVTSKQQGDSVITTRYDLLKRPLEITDPEGRVTRFQYEHIKSALLTTETDPKGYQTITKKNGFDKVFLTLKKDPFGSILSKQERFYSKTGELIEIVVHIRQVQRIVAVGNHRRIGKCDFYWAIQSVISI